jgi:hypothetical protein
MGTSPYHWLIVAALLAYIWLLFKIAKPKSVSNPVAPIQSSRSRLTVQTVVAWLCAIILGVWTLGLVATSAIRPHASPGDASGQITDLVFELGVPLLFALSIRWTRSVMRTRKVSRMAQP